MTQVPPKDIIHNYLDKVCGDRSFEKSPRNVRLLKFLVEKAIEGADVNQYIIGIELFEQNYKPEQNDSKVRVYMFNLRKKLEEYYTHSGENDELIFQLDKGQYNLQFVERVRGKKAPGKREQGKQMPVKKLIYFALLLAIINAFVILLLNTSFTHNYCWEEFFAKDADNICIVADQVMCLQPSGGDNNPTIVEHVNSESDFIKYKEQYPDIYLKLADYTLFSKMAPFSTKSLNTWFINNNSDFDLRLESRMEVEEFRNNNILYIGQFKTMNASQTVFLRDSKVFKTCFSPHGFVYSSESENHKYLPHKKDGVFVEYAMVSFMKLNSGKPALYFVSNNDIGVMATVNNFTNPEWLSEFYSKLSSNSSYFNALFEVKGLRRTEVSCELIHLEEVEY